MSRPIIENSDRGITLNKTLAWTILSSLAVAVFWAGSTVQQSSSSTAELTKAIEAQKDAQDEARKERSMLDGRIRTLETTSAQTVVQYVNVTKSLDEVKQSQAETNALIRQMLGGPR